MASADRLKKELELFRTRSALLADLYGAAAVLGWDQQTYMPAAGNSHRASQAAALSGIVHEKMVDPAYGDSIAFLQDNADRLSAEDRAAVRVAARDRDRAVRLPARLVEDLTHAEAEGLAAWQEARSGDDFSVFQPFLERTLQLQREKAETLGYAGHPWDALHDEFEPGSTAAAVRDVFTPLGEFTVRLLERIRNSGHEADDSLLERPYDEELQEQFGREVASQFGFDFLRGRLDRAAHPFATGFGPDDVRITTRYDRNFLSTAIFGIFHEAGHGIYEQGLDPDQARSPLGQAVSLAVHESQSRLWENLIGRSASFWEFAWPRLSELFPDALGSVSRTEFHRAVNTVRPGLIRVEADEVTYNLHIMIRFELELALLEGTLEPAGLPAAWNELYRERLGLDPSDDADGCLQDVHWSLGLFGYFPTYALGNLMSVQLLHAHERDNPGLWDQVRTGDFSRLLDWLNTNVHRHGSMFTPAELLRNATGSDLDAGPYTDYLENKYGRLYGLTESGND